MYSTFWHFLFLFTGRGRWLKWVQQLPARFTKHYLPDRQWPRKHRHGGPHWGHLLREWLLVSMGPVHCTDWTNRFNGAIHDWKVSWVSQFDTFLCSSHVFLYTVVYKKRNFCSGNHERDWPGTGSFYGNLDSGGECGVPAQTVFYTPAENRAKFW